MAVQMSVDVIFLDILLPNVIVVEMCPTAGNHVTGMLLLVFRKTDPLLFILWQLFLHLTNRSSSACPLGSMPVGMWWMRWLPRVLYCAARLRIHWGCLRHPQP
jgi:hypothetical protein